MPACYRLKVQNKGGERKVLGSKNLYRRCGGLTNQTTIRDTKRAKFKENIKITRPMDRRSKSTCAEQGNVAERKSHYPQKHGNI